MDRPTIEDELSPSVPRSNEEHVYAICLLDLGKDALVGEIRIWWLTNVYTCRDWKVLGKSAHGEACDYADRYLTWVGGKHGSKEEVSESDIHP
jgi:hypothetical protein